MEEYPKAQQPEILHQINKDGEVLSVLNSKLLSGLELFIQPKNLYKNRKIFAIFGAFLYYLGNSYRLRQTIGEEYAYVRQFHKKEYVYLSKRRMLLFAFLSSFGCYLLQKLSKRVESLRIKRISGFQDELSKLQKLSGEDKKAKYEQMMGFGSRTRVYINEFIKNFGEIDEFFDNVVMLNLAMFYIKGEFPSVIKRILGIEYRAVVKMKPHAFTYEKVGYIIIFKLALSLVKYIYTSVKSGMKRSRDIMEILTKEEIEEKANGSEEDQEDLEESRCGVCFDKRENCSVTPCGHLYCYDCIVKSLGYRDECPQCREKVKLEEVIQLANYN